MLMLVLCRQKVNSMVILFTEMVIIVVWSFRYKILYFISNFTVGVGKGLIYLDVIIYLIVFLSLYNKKSYF